MLNGFARASDASVGEVTLAVLMANARGRERFEGEMLAALKFLNNGMRSISEQRSAFEAHVLDSVRVLSREVETLVANQRVKAGDSPCESR